MASFANVARFNAASAGTGAFVVSSTVTGYQTPASAQVTNGAIHKYRAESSDLSQWEVGYGAYTVAGTSLARTTILSNSSGTTSAINFSAAPQVALLASAEDIIPTDGALFGLTLSTAGSSATFTTAAGWAADSTAVNILRLYASLAKTTSAWAVGAASGALDTGAIANSTWYHVFIIKRLDTGVTDVLISLSATAPTMPTNYTLFRRIGSMKTNGSAQWTKFSQNGDEFLWDVIVADVAAANPGTAGTLYTLTVPTGIIVNVIGYGLYFNTGAANYLTVSSPAIAAPTAGIGTASLYSGSGTTPGSTGLSQRTNTSAQIRLTVSDAAGASAYVNTYGWNDTRGRDS